MLIVIKFVISVTIINSIFTSLLTIVYILFVNLFHYSGLFNVINIVININDGAFKMDNLSIDESIFMSRRSHDWYVSSVDCTDNVRKLSQLVKLEFALNKLVRMIWKMNISWCYSTDAVSHTLKSTAHGCFCYPWCVSNHPLEATWTVEFKRC